MKANRPVAAIGAAAIGTAMRVKTWKREQPSTVAASNRPCGIFRKNTERMNTVKGNALAECTRMMASLVPSNPTACSIM